MNASTPNAALAPAASANPSRSAASADITVKMVVPTRGNLEIMAGVAARDGFAEAAGARAAFGVEAFMPGL